MQVTFTKEMQFSADGGSDVRTYEAGKSYKSGHAQESKMFDWCVRNGYAVEGVISVEAPKEETKTKVARKHKTK